MMLRMRVDPEGFSRMMAGGRVFTYLGLFFALPMFFGSLYCLISLPSYSGLSPAIVVSLAAVAGVLCVFGLLLMLTEFGFLLPIEAVDESVRSRELLERLLEKLGSKRSSVESRIEDLLAVETELSNLEHKLPTWVPPSSSGKKGKKKRSSRNAKPPSLAERVELLSAEVKKYREEHSAESRGHEKELAQVSDEARRVDAENSQLRGELEIRTQELADSRAQARELQAEKERLQRQVAEFFAERRAKDQRLEELLGELALVKEQLATQAKDAHEQREALRKELRKERAAREEEQKSLLERDEAEKAEVAKNVESQRQSLQRSFELELQKRDAKLAEAQERLAQLTLELDAARLSRLELGEQYRLEIRALKEIEISRHPNSVLRRNIQKLNALLEVFETRLFIASLFAEDGKWEWVQVLCRPTRLPDAFREILGDLPEPLIDEAEKRQSV